METKIIVLILLILLILYLFFKNNNSEHMDISGVIKLIPRAEAEAETKAAPATPAAATPASSALDSPAAPAPAKPEKPAATPASSALASPAAPAPAKPAAAPSFGVNYILLTDYDFFTANASVNPKYWVIGGIEISSKEYKKINVKILDNNNKYMINGININASIYENKYPVANIIDTNVDTYYHSNINTKNSILIDLGGTHNIESIKLVSRLLNCQYLAETNRLNNTHIYLLNLTKDINKPNNFIHDPLNMSHTFNSDWNDNTKKNEIIYGKIFNFENGRLISTNNTPYGQSIKCKSPPPRTYVNKTPCTIS